MATHTDTYQAAQNNTNLTAPGPHSNGHNGPMEKDFENGKQYPIRTASRLELEQRDTSSQGATSMLNVGLHTARLKLVA